MINKMINKRINEVLNEKEIRCLGCSRLINFTTSRKESDKPHIINLNTFTCSCGETNILEGLAYVQLSDKSHKELMELLNEKGILTIDKDNFNLDNFNLQLKELENSLDERRKDVEYI